jgi:hypothetical protein
MQRFEADTSRLVSDQCVEPFILDFFGRATVAAEKEYAVMLVVRMGAGNERIATGNPRDKTHLDEEVHGTIDGGGSDRPAGEMAKDLDNFVGASWRPALQQDTEDQPPELGELSPASSALLRRAVQFPQDVTRERPLQSGDTRHPRDTLRHGDPRLQEVLRYNVKCRCASEYS